MNSSIWWLKEWTHRVKFNSDVNGAFPLFLNLPFLLSLSPRTFSPFLYFFPLAPHLPISHPQITLFLHVACSISPATHQAYPQNIFVSSTCSCVPHSLIFLTNLLVSLPSPMSNFSPISDVPGFSPSPFNCLLTSWLLLPSSSLFSLIVSHFCSPMTVVPALFAPGLSLPKWLMMREFGNVCNTSMMDWLISVIIWWPQTLVKTDTDTEMT